MWRRRERKHAMTWPFDLELSLLIRIKKKKKKDHALSRYDGQPKREKRGLNGDMKWLRRLILCWWIVVIHPMYLWPTTRGMARLKEWKARKISDFCCLGTCGSWASLEHSTLLTLRKKDSRLLRLHSQPLQMSITWKESKLRPRARRREKKKQRWSKLEFCVFLAFWR